MTDTPPETDNPPIVQRDTRRRATIRGAAPAAGREGWGAVTAATAALDDRRAAWVTRRTDMITAHASGLPALHTELEAAVCRSAEAGTQRSGKRHAKAEKAWAAPLPISEAIYDALANPDPEGRLGITATVVGLAAVTRAALGHSPSQRVREAGPAVTEACRYLEAQAEVIAEAQAWTPAATRLVRGLWDQATVGLDLERVRDSWAKAGDAGRGFLLHALQGCERPWFELGETARAEHRATCPRGEEPHLEWDAESLDAQLTAAHAASSESLSDFYGRWLDAIHARYDAAGAGPEQWSDHVAGELHRVTSTAKHLLGLMEVRSRPTGIAPCPFCDAYTLLLAEGSDRSDVPFVACASCQRSWSLDTLERDSDAALIFRSFMSAGWVPACDGSGECQGLCARCRGAAAAG